jgi:ribosomal protein S18 acetylase RimI-like enzyme
MPRKSASKTPGRPVAPPVVRLVPMSPKEFGPFLERTIREYARDLVRSGRTTQEGALAMSQKDVERLLPKGLETPGNSLFSVWAGGSPGEPVGVLWIHVAESKAFVYNIVIESRHQGQGLGRATMLAAEEVARQQGALSIGLHVFGHNKIARKLYSDLGYETTDLVMVKPLAGPAHTEP